VSLSSAPPFLIIDLTGAGVALIIIGTALAVGWAVVLFTHGRNVLEDNPRLGYCVCDVSLLSVGCVVTGIGLVGNHAWAKPLLLVAVGAAAFDLTHTFIYCAEISWPKPFGFTVPTWIYSVVILAVLGVLMAIAWSDIDRITNYKGIPAGIFWASIGLGLATGVGIALATAAVRRRSVMISSGLPVK
jgi:hypothetical protein